MASHIAQRLGREFAQAGFGPASVDQLRAAAGVSLRTLYRHFPSREAMVLGALDWRHRAYMDLLTADPQPAPPPSPDGILQIFRRSGQWLDQNRGAGCLFLRAATEHPQSKPIRAKVTAHKQATRQLLCDRIKGVVPPHRADALTLQLVTLLEGQTFTALTEDPAQVTRHTVTTVHTLVREAQRP